MTTTIKPLFQSATETLVEAFETRLGFSLPRDYRHFLIDFNGGRPHPNCTHIADLNEDVLVDVLFGLTAESGCGLEQCHDEFGDELPSGFLIIGGDPGGGMFILGSEHSTAGVYYWDHQHFFAASSEESGNTYLLADSFSSWLESLRSLER